MKYIYQDMKTTIIFTSLHEALRYINTHKFATLTDASTGRLIDKTSERTRNAAQSLLSQSCDALGKEHIKIEKLYERDGALLEAVIIQSLDRQEILEQEGAGYPYVKALIHFFMLEMAKK